MAQRHPKHPASPKEEITNAEKSVQIYISCNFEKRLGNVEGRNYILQQRIARLKKRWAVTQRQGKTQETDAEKKELVQTLQTKSGGYSLSSQSTTAPSIQSSGESSEETSASDFPFINSMFDDNTISRVKRKARKPNKSKKKKMSLDYIHVTGYGGQADSKKNIVFPQMRLPKWLRWNKRTFAELNTDGELSVRKPGVYILYSQVTSKAGSYEVRLQSARTSETSTVVNCTGGGQTDGYSTCSSTTVVKVDRGDILYLCSKSTDSVMFTENATYFGIVKIG